MLKSIQITKLFGRFDYELSFSNEGIMIITGPNGYGKSTILRIINNFCNSSLDKVLAYTFKKLIIVGDNGSVQIAKNKNNFKIKDNRANTTHTPTLIYIRRNKLSALLKSSNNCLNKSITQINFLVKKETPLIQPSSSPPI